jgi:hypothetical protein
LQSKEEHNNTFYDTKLTKSVILKKNCLAYG